MPIKNINVIQYPELIEDNIKNEYIQSLANLGQRVGIKNDSIKYYSFDFIKCFDSFIDDEDVLKYEYIKANTNNFVGYIQYDNSYGYNSGKIGIIDRQNLLDREGYVNNIDISNSINQNNISYSFEEIFNIKFIEEGFEFGNVVSINNINHYLDKSILKIKNNNLYTLLFGGFDDNQDIEVAYNIYDLSTNKAKKCLRLFSIEDGYYLFEYNFLINNLRIYYLNNENDGYINSDLNIYLLKDRLNNVEKKDIVRLINNLITDENDTIFDYFYNNGDYIDIKFVYDTEENTRISINNLSSQIENNNVDHFNEEGNSLIDLINDRTIYINNDNRDLFIKLIEYYHNNYFCKNQSTIILRILENIYESLIEENGINYENNVNIENLDIITNRFVLYFPLDYNINYIGNKTNQFDIFYTNDIFINKINLEDTVKDNLYNEDIFNNIIFSSNLFTQSIFEVHNVKFNYNSIYNDLINYISTYFCYSLPYIDINSTNWMVNGQDSGLTSYLLNNNLQNIMIINTFNEGTLKGEYLNNINNSLSPYFNDNDLKIVEQDVDKSIIVGESENAENGKSIKNIKIKTALPKINKGNNSSDIYSNTLVISITSNIDANIDINDEFLMITIWKYNPAEGENGDWEILKDNNTGSILDLSKFLNLGLIKQRKLNSYQYIFNYLGILLNGKRDLNSSETPNGKVKVMVIKNDDKESNNELSTSINFYNTNLSLYNNIPSGDGELKNTGYFLKVDSETNFKKILESNKQSNNITNTGTITSLEDSSEGGVSSVNISQTNNQTQSSNTTIDYIFNEDVPNIDLSETFLSNTQILNRLDFTILDEVVETNDNQTDVTHKKHYHTFIGPDYSDNKRDVFCIKTSKSNKNIGTKSLIDYENINKFDKQSKLLIEFDNIELKGNLMEFESIKGNDYIINKYSKKVSLFNSDNIDVNSLLEDIFEISKDPNGYSININQQSIIANNNTINRSNIEQISNTGYYQLKNGYSIIFEKIEIISINNNQTIPNTYNIIVK